MSPGEQLIYNALLYALHGCYDTICFGFSGGADALNKIHAYLACDSPILEHNSGFRLYRCTVKLNGEKETYWCLKSSAISAEKLEKKRQAYEKGKAILGMMPKALSGEYERAKWLYAYVAANTGYVRGEACLEDAVPLYDALVEGRTNCDGFSEAVSLLYSLAGIECVSVMGKSLEQGEGHAWNAARLEGSWYMLDAANDALYFGQEALGGRLFFFALGEHMFYGMEYSPLIQNAAPVCETSAPENVPDGVLLGKNYGEAAALYRNAVAAGKRIVTLLDLEPQAHAFSERVRQIALHAGGSVHIGGLYIPLRRLLVLYPVG